MTTKEILMSTKGINKSFGATHAVVNLNINIEKGDIMGLVGENGAGKSTLIKILGGEHTVDSGEIIYQNKKISWKNSAEALKKGIAIVHQNPLLVSSLGAAENIFLGKEYVQGFFIDNTMAIEEAKKLVKQYPIYTDLDLEKPVIEMSAGEKEVVEILKALSYEPEILILDEPTASLPKDETETLLKLLTELNKTKNITIIYISHKLEEAFEICNKITVMRNGKNIGTLTRDNFNKDKLVKMMINQDISEFYPNKSKNIGNILLEANNLKSKMLRDISINVREREILGLYGLIGAGMTELVESIYGLREFEKGEIKIGNKKIQKPHVDEMIRSGVFLIPADRHQYGLFPSFTVSENITIAHLFSLFQEFLLKRSKENNAAIEQAKRINLKYADINQSIMELSGGNQQKAIVARWLLQECSVLIVDDPTVGIDIGAKRDIYRILRELTSRDKGIIFISSEINEIIGMADRIYTMRRGKITAELAKNEINQENVLKNIL
jgi:ribose transport system ATP-binding protein